jgi:RNase P subunit RPR2
MAKAREKRRDEDAWHRIAYLNQVSQLALLQDESNLSRYYSSVLKQICSRLVLRLYIYPNPSFIADRIRSSGDCKRTICKGCRGVLMPGITSQIRITKRMHEQSPTLGLTLDQAMGNAPLLFAVGHVDFSVVIPSISNQRRKQKSRRIPIANKMVECAGKPYECSSPISYPSPDDLQSELCRHRDSCRQLN